MKVQVVVVVVVIVHFISILSEFLQPKDVTLELFIWMADGNSSIVVLIQVRLLKRVWGFSQTPGCQIGSLWDHGSVCWSSRYWIGNCAYCRYMPPMLRVKIRVLWMKWKMLFYEYHLLNLQALCGILMYILEQTQLRGRMWLKNMESVEWIKTEGIYYSSVVATV